MGVVLEPKAHHPLCLIHLVREANGPEPLTRFLESYRRHTAGIEHDLVLLLKGFASREQAATYLEKAEGLQAECVFVPDDGFDLDAYTETARRLQRDRYCFVNSFSVILADGWLAMLDLALSEPRAGMVGATGSWASPRSHALRELGVVPTNAYRAVFPDRRWMREQFAMLRREQADDANVRLAGLHLRINTWRSAAEALRGFPGFPAPHLRTNTFMLKRETIARLKLHRARRKIHAYGLESGWRSITRQVQELGLRTLVVDREGAAFEPGEWHMSRTFWQGDQEGLMVADNQTTVYAHGDLDRRTLLARLAWGLLADPVSPRS